MSKKAVILSIMSLFFFKSNAQDNDLYQKRFFTIAGEKMNYRIMFPAEYDESRSYPLIMFLHGSGERGDDNKAQLIHGSSFFAREDIRNDYPAFVVFPQCAKEDYWSNSLNDFDLETRERHFYFRKGGAPTTAMEMASALLAYLLDSFPIDTDRVYLGGLSMGGMGTFEMVRRHPGIFAAAFPICGGANTETAASMTDVSWWIFHGEKDMVVPVEFSKKMAESLQKAGAEVKLTLYPEANHNSWDPAFTEKDLMKWLFSQSRK